MSNTDQNYNRNQQGREQANYQQGSDRQNERYGGQGNRDYQQSEQAYSNQSRGQNGPYGRGGQYSDYQGNYPQGGYGGFQHSPQGGVGQGYQQGMENRYGQQNYGGQQGYPQPNYGGAGFESREYQQYTPQGTQYDSRSGWRQEDTDRNYGNQSGQSQSGNNRGPHSGRGPKGYQRSDERIREEVCQCLSDHGDVDASEIEVSCKDGEVTLSGTCCSRQTKRMAEDACDCVSGVTDVNNQLKVKKSSDDSSSDSGSKSKQKSSSSS